MNKKFKISSVLAALAVSGMLIGCGGSSDSDDSNNDKNTTDGDNTVVDVRTCSFTVDKSEIEVGSITIDANNTVEKVLGVSALDGKKNPLTDANITGLDKVDFTKIAEYPLMMTSPSCDEDKNVTVSVIAKKVIDKPDYDDSLGLLKSLVIK